MEIESGSEEYETILLKDILAEGRMEKSIFSHPKHEYTFPHKKVSHHTPVPKDQHKDD